MAKASKKVRVGMVGVSGIAGAHYRGYDSPEGKELGEIYALCDIREDLLEAEAEKREIPAKRCFTDFRELVKLDRLDAVDICTPNQFHHEPAIAAAEAGKHVMVEKPIAISGKLGQQMVDAAAQAGVILQVGCNTRFTSGAQALKRFIDAGEFGEIYHARAVAFGRRRIPGASFVKKSTAGVGVLADIGVHILDRILWLVGYPKPTVALGSAFAKFGGREDYINLTSWAAPWDPKDFGVEDFAAAIVKFENGMQVVIETGWAGNVDSLGPSYILGTEAGCTVEPQIRIFGQKHGTIVNVEPVTTGKGGGHAEEIIAFLKAVRDGTPSLVPGGEVVITSHIFDAIYESTKTGREAEVGAES